MTQLLQKNLPSTRAKAREQNSSYYFTGRSCPKGHVSPRYTSSACCRACNLSKESSEYRKGYRAKNPEKGKAWKAKYRSTEKGCQVEQAYAAKPAQKARRCKYMKTPEGVASRKKSRNRPQARIANNFRRRTLLAFEAAQQEKNHGTRQLLGCTWDVLIKHLSLQFKPGMTLENHGRWHIDHIRPVASFDLSDSSQVAQCFHYTNLQPLWEKENLSKAAKM